MRNYGFTQERHFWHKVVGFSYRMTNVQAAIGLGQLERIDDLLGARIRNAELYNSLLKDVPGIVTPPRAEECVSAYWMYGILVRDEYGMGRDELRQALADQGIETRSFFIPIHLQPVYAHLYADDYPVSEELGTRGLYLPSSSGLKPAQIAFIAECIRKSARA
jgi:perosamine synthetase